MQSYYTAKIAEVAQSLQTGNVKRKGLGNENYLAT